ncbi:CX3C chemokine receptor 1 [Holothuria leucospilota]|uniref:CX3C chemokine receptor 1 n=1 Tax=Holothuria leucospilota TaxID=206669 RepID=A0A9Q1H0Q0_HOLLE|nr:CX3C chemokine receptor 1 [Holothuria leucospilota]
MTLDRYKVILRPMESLTSRTVTRTTMTNLTIWIVSLLVHLPSLIFFRVGNMGTTCLSIGVRFCGVEDLNNTYFVSYEIFSKFIMYIIPFIIMSYCYLRIVRSVWNKYQLASLSNAYNDTRRRQKVKVTQMTVLVVLLFGICWGPLHVIHLIGYLRGSDKKTFDQNRRFATFCLCLAYSNAALNPFVYALTGRYYREILHQACLAKAFSKKRNAAIPPTSTTRAGQRRQSLDLPFDPKMLGIQRSSYENPDRRMSSGIRNEQTSALVPAKRHRPSEGSPLRILPKVDQDIVNQRAEILRRKYSLDDDFV